MRRPIPIRHMTDILFTLTLFCVLAASALMAVVFGARVYGGVVTRMDENFGAGTSLTYISNKIRQNDSLGAVYLDEVEGSPALVLERALGASAYQTWIYYDDGALKEVMVPTGTDVVRSAGQPIVEVDGFFMEEVEEGLFRFTSRDLGGREASLLIGLRSEPMGGATVEIV